MSISTRSRILLVHLTAGSALGVLILHPFTTAVSWIEFREFLPTEMTLWQFIMDRLRSDILMELFPMNLLFASIGGIIGVGFGIYHLKLAGQNLLVRHLESELARDLPSLIHDGENERTEFKSSVRWDIKQNKVNLGLEWVIAKTIAGFMNHRGGNLLAGVGDDGNILGITDDYRTLKHQNRDGFEQCVMRIVQTRMGADRCALVHCVFYEVEGDDVCRIVVEPSNRPVYCHDGKTARYFLRTGNGTRELDAQEAISRVTGHA